MSMTIQRRLIYHAAIGRVFYGLAIAAATAVLTSCVSVGVVKLSQNTARVVVHGSGFHDATAAQHWAFRQSAITTIQCGFDQFIVLSADADGRNAADWGSTPVDALIIRMYHADDSSPEALDAREILGKDWETVVDRDQRPIVGCQWSASDSE